MSAGLETIVLIKSHPPTRITPNDGKKTWFTNPSVSTPSVVGHFLGWGQICGSTAMFGATSLILMPKYH